MSKNEELIVFPCEFPVKIIGTNSAEFIQEIMEITLRHFPEFEESQHCQQKESKQSNYLSLTLVVYALDQTSLDNFYREVTAHPEVKMVL